MLCVEAFRLMFLLRAEGVCACAGGGAALALAETSSFGAVLLLLPLLLLLLPPMVLFTLAHFVRELGGDVGLDGVELRQGLVPQAFATGGLEVCGLLTLALRLGTALLGLGAAVVRRLTEHALRALVVHLSEVEKVVVHAVAPQSLGWQCLLIREVGGGPDARNRRALREHEVETDTLVAVRHSLLLWQRIVVGACPTKQTVGDFNFIIKLKSWLAHEMISNSFYAKEAKNVQHQGVRVR